MHSLQMSLGGWDPPGSTVEKNKCREPPGRLLGPDQAFGLGIGVTPES